MTKEEGGDFYQEPLDRMDRKKQQDKFVLLRDVARKINKFMASLDSHRDI